MLMPQGVMRSLQIAVYSSVASVCALKWAGSAGYAPTGAVCVSNLIAPVYGDAPANMRM